MLGELIGRAAAQLGAAPSDFPHLSLADRSHLAWQLDQRALYGDLSANAVQVPSPALAQWLACPSAKRGAINFRQHALDQALSQFADGMSDAWDWFPVAQLEVAGLDLVVEVHRFRPNRFERSLTPWNADLSRRVVFIKPAGDLVDIADVLHFGRDA